MVKRFKKQKKTKTQKAVTSNNTKTPEIKVSEAVLDVCKPFLIRHKEPRRMETIASIGVLAWNISFIPKEEQAHIQKKILDTLSEKFSREDTAVLSDIIKMSIERKENIYPHIRMHIVNHELSFSNNTLTLDVTAAPVPEIPIEYMEALLEQKTNIR